MEPFLVGILFHEAEPYRNWKAGLTEDFESSTGLFVEAPDAAAAIAWGEEVGQELLRYVNDEPGLDWKALGYHCWIVPDPLSSEWKHCLDFFRRVAVGEMPPVEEMTGAAYERWVDRTRPSGPEAIERPNLLQRLASNCRKFRLQ